MGMSVVVQSDYGVLIIQYTRIMSLSFYMTNPVTFNPFVINSSDIWWQVQIMNLYIMQFSFNFLSISAIKFPRTKQHHCQTQPSLSSMSQTECHTHIYENPTQIHTHTRLHLKCHVITKQEEEQNL
jgi:hypothetical protein